MDATTSTPPPPSDAVPKKVKAKKPRLRRTVALLPTSTMPSNSWRGDATALVVQRRSCHAKLPTVGSSDAAGCDLYAAENVTISPHGYYAVTTDLAVISFPDHCYGRLAGRSGLALHHGIMVGAGVIDRDYRGAIKVVLFNFSGQPFVVTIGLRIAQLICECYVRPNIHQHTISGPTFDDNGGIVRERGENGFGSSGQW